VSVIVLALVSLLVDVDRPKPYSTIKNVIKGHVANVV